MTRLTNRLSEAERIIYSIKSGSFLYDPKCLTFGVILFNAPVVVCFLVVQQCACGILGRTFSESGHDVAGIFMFTSVHLAGSIDFDIEL